MKIQVQLFAGLRETAGTNEVILEVPPGTTPRQAAQLLAERFPAIRAQLDSISYAVDGEIAPAETVLPESCELALLPPVSGGC